MTYSFNMTQALSRDMGEGMVKAFGAAIIDISGATFDTGQQILSFAGLDPTALFFKPDGTEVYAANKTGANTNIYQYTLSTAWDLTTASAAVTLTTTRNTVTRGITFNSDGTKMFLFDSADKFIERWTLSTGWDITSATFDTGQTSSAVTGSTSAVLAPDLVSVFELDGVTLRKHTFASAGDMTSTLTLDVQTLDLTAYGTSTLSNAVCTPDGLTMLLTNRGTTHYIVLQFGTAYDLSTATVSSVKASFAEETNPTTGVIVPEEGYLFAAGVSFDDLNRYSY